MGYDYGYDYMYDTDYYVGNTLIAVMMMIYLAIIAVVVIAALVNYIFRAIGLYTIAKRMGKNYPWLAFIPFANAYLHGDLAGEIRFKKRSVKNPGLWKLLLPIIYGAVITGFVLMIFIALVFMAAVSTGGGHGAEGMMILTVFALYGVLILLAIAYSAVRLSLNALIDIRIFERLTTHNMAVVHAVLSVIIPFYEAICLFVLRNREFVPDSSSDEKSDIRGEEPDEKVNTPQEEQETF